ncbi:MAG TPA: sigma-70 family RNA polymerase sigma factor [Frankiaceae bacterium]|nr:sigma-70 family RNA polymerase sigma factor [Frankiaceae bacterium]
MTVTPLPRPDGPPGFDEFFQEYFVRVLALIRKHFPACDAEEIAQETMARCYTNYDAFDPHRDPWPWVNTTARNAAIDSLRRNRRLVSTDELPEAVGGVEDVTYDAVLVLERRHSLRTAMKRLRAADRQLLVDHELEGMAYTEMAALRDVTPNALRQQLHRARGRLAAELQRVGATLGIVPVALHARFDRLTRRLHDLSAAAGPAGATAFGVMAVAGAATVATVLGGPAAPATAAALAPPRGEVVQAVDRATRPVGAVAAARPAAAPVRAATATTPVTHRPGTDGPRGPELPVVRISSDGDPVNDPDKPSRREVTVPTPLGDLTVGEYWESTPFTCTLGLRDCPTEE